MKNSWLKTILYSILLAIIFAFFFIFTWKIFDRIFFMQSDYNIQFLSAFAGAFFAFLFIRIGDGLAKIYERAVKHYNGLVKLEYLLNTYLNEINDNIFILDSFKNTISKGGMCLDEFKALPVNDELLIELNNIELIRELFDLNVTINKLNRSMATVSRIYTELRLSHLDKKNNLQTFNFNIRGVLKNIDLLIISFNDLDIKTIRCLSKARIRASKDRPFFTKISQYISNIDSGIKEGELSNEIIKLRKEIEQVREKSQKELDGLKK